MGGFESASVTRPNAHFEGWFNLKTMTGALEASRMSLASTVVAIVPAPVSQLLGQ